MSPLDANKLALDNARLEKQLIALEQQIRSCTEGKGLSEERLRQIRACINDRSLSMEEKMYKIEHLTQI
jgi:hypothetical protein